MLHSLYYLSDNQISMLKYHARWRLMSSLLCAVGDTPLPLWHPLQQGKDGNTGPHRLC